MKLTKTIFIIALALVLVFSLAACGGGDDEVVAEPPEVSAEGVISDDNNQGELSWWEGEWYGYWVAEKAGGSYADWDGGKWDCYAVIDVNSDSSATMYIWDDEIDIATAEIKIDLEGGIAPMGSANSTGGYAFTEPLDYADWTIIPTYDGYEDYYGNIKFDDYMEFEGLVDTDDAYLRYTIVLRPWGLLWDDVPSEDRPPFYEDWYKEKGLYQEPSMLEVLSLALLDGSPAHIHSALSGGSPAETSAGTDSGSADSGSAASGSNEAVILDLTNAELKDKWEAFRDSFNEWSEITYDQVVALLGSPGMIDREGDTFIDYRWYAADDGSLTVQFKIPSGEFARSSMNAYGRPN